MGVAALAGSLAKLAKLAADDRRCHKDYDPSC